jgi:glycosyltransferase involved in cell wall biosynthesis
MPYRKNDIAYFKLPVENLDLVRKDSDRLRLLFAGRFVTSKGIELLPQIDVHLGCTGINYCWNIAGYGEISTKYLDLFSQSNTNFYGSLLQRELFEVFTDSDIIILPSYVEGTPMVIVEAMKCGVVPIVNDLEGGMQEIVQNNFTGFLIEQNSPKGYSDKIKLLFEDRSLLNEISKNASKFAKINYDPIVNTHLIETYFIQNGIRINKRQAIKVVGSRLDCKYLPNVVTTSIRKFYNR